MDIIVKTPSRDEEKLLRSKPVWECGISQFDWHYDEQETCLVLEGEVAVDYMGKSVSFKAGDMVIFSQGLDCVWKVTKPIKKHYMFG